MSFTFAQMRQLSDTLQDKSGSPYWTAPQFDRLCNMAYNIWIRLNYLKFEQSEEAKYKLRNLTLPFTVVNTRFVTFTGDIPKSRYIVRSNATFEIKCGTKVSLVRVNLNPVQNNRIDNMESDPFNRGTDQEPNVIQTTSALGVPELQVFSDTIPVEISGLYVRMPQIIDVTNNPNTIFEQDDDLTQEIVNMLAVTEDAVIENYQRMQALSQGVAQKMSG